MNFTAILDVRINNAVIKAYTGKQFNTETLREVQGAIKQTLVETFSGEFAKLDDKTISWLTNQYMRRLNVKLTDSNTFSGDDLYYNDYELKELPYADVVLISSLYVNTDVGKTMKIELENRKQNARQN